MAARVDKKEKLVQQLDEQLKKYPGIDFNFSQNIQDNVEEAMSGVKGENSIKLFGDDIDVLVTKAGEISDVMAKVPGIADLGVFQETGQPELLVSINRSESARYGLMAADVDAAVRRQLAAWLPRKFWRATGDSISRSATGPNSGRRRKRFETFFCQLPMEIMFRWGKWLTCLCTKVRS